MRRSRLAWMLLLLATAAACAGAEEPLRVLWVGNSHTYRNDLPRLVRELAKAAGVRPLQTKRETPGGCTFEKHVKRGRLPKLLAKGRWDYVVLQEQGQRPGWSRAQRARQVTPYAKQLCAQIKAAKAKPLFFMTWARRDGDPLNFPKDTYQKMQKRLQTGYSEMARQNSGQVVPVGTAWQKALGKKRPGLQLWAKDGSHPSREGSYLAACVFFKFLYRKSPVGNSYTAKLKPELAKFLQQIADRTR